VFTARYALCTYIKQMGFVFKGLSKIITAICPLFAPNCMATVALHIKHEQCFICRGYTAQIYRTRDDNACCVGVVGATCSMNERE
jgi:hypothetical protein